MVRVLYMYLQPELSTQVFKTLTMLFNNLRGPLLKDMNAVHKCYVPLLSHPKPFMRDFAAQTLSILLWCNHEATADVFDHVLACPREWSSA